MNNRVPQILTKDNQVMAPWVEYSRSLDKSYNFVPRRDRTRDYPEMARLSVDNYKTQLGPSSFSSIKSFCHRSRKRPNIMPPYPSRHHCPQCKKKTKSMAVHGHCTDHQWVCNNQVKNGAAYGWVQMWNENCEVCGAAPPDQCRQCRTANPRKKK